MICKGGGGFLLVPGRWWSLGCIFIGDRDAVVGSGAETGWPDTWVPHLALGMDSGVVIALGLGLSAQTPGFCA